MSDLVRAYVTGHHRRTDDEWRDLIRAEGFTRDGVPAERPKKPLTLYRGAAVGRHRSLSWTTDRAVAMRWATSEGQKSHVWRLWAIDECPPDAMLAMWNGRHEAEVIVDCQFPDVFVREWTDREAKECPPMQRSQDYAPIWQKIMTPAKPSADDWWR